LIEANLIPGVFPYGSCIIVITREESVARHCATSADAVCRVRGLEADAARRLFQVCVCIYMLHANDLTSESTVILFSFGEITWIRNLIASITCFIIQL
jgi:hypothetical protein